MSAFGEPTSGAGVTFCYVNKGRVFVKENGVYKDYGTIKGTVTKISFRDREWDKGNGVKEIKEECCIDMVHEGKKYQLQLPFDSGYFRAFAKAFSNADPQKEVVLQPQYEEKDGNKVASMFVNQFDGNGWVACKWAFTNAVPNGMPEKEKFTAGRKEIISYDKQNAFLKEHLLNTVSKVLLPDIIAGPPTQFDPIPKTGPARQPAALEPEGPIDDLPF